MEFIKAEEFLKQPKEVQEVFLEWWKPSIGDIFLIEKTTSFNGDKHNFIECFLTGFEVADLTETERKRIICPLLTEGPLRKFIEDKTGKILFIDFEKIDGKLNYSIYLFQDNDRYENYDNLGDDLLQAYWKVACEIAKESVENEYK